MLLWALLASGSFSYAQDRRFGQASFCSPEFIILICLKEFIILICLKDGDGESPLHQMKNILGRSRSLS
jgi:hypothetical protein